MKVETKAPAVKVGKGTAVAEISEKDLPWKAVFPHRIVHYDEGKKLLQKESNKSLGAGLITTFTKLFESNSHETGSFKNGYARVANANVSLLLHFVRNDFEQTFAGTGLPGDGFLSRCVIVADGKRAVKGDWRIVDSAAVRMMVGYIRQCCKRAELPIELEADAARLAFLQEIRSWDPTKAARLEFHFNQDLVFRGLFSPEAAITTEIVERSVAWTRHQYRTRLACWPVDGSRDQSEVMSNTILAAIEKHKRLTKSQLVKLANARRPGSGGLGVRASLFRPAEGHLKIVGHTRTKTPVFGPADDQ
jgi:hypothetical protein